MVGQTTNTFDLCIPTSSPLSVNENQFSFKSGAVFKHIPNIACETCYHVEKMGNLNRYWYQRQMLLITCPLKIDEAGKPALQFQSYQRWSASDISITEKGVSGGIRTRDHKTNSKGKALTNTKSISWLVMGLTSAEEDLFKVGGIWLLMIRKKYENFSTSLTSLWLIKCFIYSGHLTIT